MAIWKYYSGCIPQSRGWYYRHNYSSWSVVSLRAHLEQKNSVSVGILSSLGSVIDVPTFVLLGNLDKDHTSNRFGPVEGTP